MEDYYTIQTEGLHSELFAELHTLQKQGVLCDVILAAEDGEVMAHKVILMAVSKYFREKLSPVVSSNPSRICLKGISVVELANLVKYIYTGKLLVAKETMDVTLEVSEILELTGVTQGYKDIITYEQMKTDGEVDSLPGGGNAQEIHLTEKPVGSKESSTTTNVRSNAFSASNSESHSDTALLTVTSTASELPENQEAESQEVRVTEYFQDGTSRVYTADHPEQAHSGTGHTSNEYQFEFNPYDKQYMDVSVGANLQASASSNLPRLQKMASAGQRVSDEQARHQDLLTVAIETLSDPSHFIGGIPKHVGETETVISNVTTEVVDPAGSETAYQNGQIESKIVTLNAGTVANELGGQTSVYTVALDPSSITKPLVMPRILRKKSEKEKQAEMAAKMYRKKKADLLNRTAIITPVAQKEDAVVKRIYQPTAKLIENATDESTNTKRTPKILLRSFSPRKKEMVQPDQLQHIMIYRSLDGQITTSKMTGSKHETLQSPVRSEDVKMSEHAKEFGQVVNFDSDVNEDESLESAHISVEKGKESNITENISTDRSSPNINDRTIVPGICEKAVENLTKTISVAKKEAESSKDSLEGPVESEVNKGNNKEVEDLQNEMLHSPDSKSNDNDNSPLFDCHESQTRSSATKRKGKVPRRIPLDENKDNKNKIPLVRSRKNSRTETVVGTGRNVRTTRARSVNLDGTEAAEENKDINEIKTTKHADAKQDNSSNIKEMKMKDIQFSTDNKKHRDPEKKHLSKISLKTSTQELQSKGMSAGEIQQTYQDIKCANVEECAMNNADIDDNCDNTLNKKDDNSESEHGSEIDLDMSVDNIQEMEMTVDEIHQTKDQTESAKRKANSDGEDISVKRKKTASESDGSETSDNEKGNKQLKTARTSTGRVMYLCPEPDCKCLGNTKASIRKHQAFVHGRTDKSWKTSTTNICKNELIKPKVVKVFKKEALTCDCCDIKFETIASLQAHLEMSCVDCSEQFSSQFDLLCHRTRSHGDAVPKAATSYSCPVCKYVSGTFKSIDKHMSLHEGCHVQCVCCDKCFKTFGEMKKHLVTHSEKRYKCSSCEFVSNVLACVNIHYKLKHTKDKEMTKCQFCNYKTPLHGNLRKHMLTGHELVVVTKQSHENREKYRDFAEGTLLTIDGKVFDPDTMKVPKMSQRKFVDGKDEKTKTTVQEKQKPIKEEKPSISVEKRRRPALHKLSTEEFTKEVLKRHQEYMTKPEKNQRFMSQSLARATAHPSFPQASPCVRQTKADKIYNAQKAPHRFQDLSSTETQEYISAAASNVPTAVNEIEVIHHDTGSLVTENVQDSVHTVLTIPETSGASEMEQFIVVTNDGKESVMPTKELYSALMQRENSMETKETIGVINALLAAGTEVQIEEQDIRHVEIQNE